VDIRGLNFADPYLVTDNLLADQIRQSHRISLTNVIFQLAAKVWRQNDLHKPSSFTGFQEEPIFPTDFKKHFEPYNI
jgi:hypothetical protein